MEAKFTVNSSVQYYGENSTVHGVAAIHNSRSKITKCAFVLLMAALLPSMAISIVRTIQSFFSYKVFNTVEKVYVDEIPFPSVTICRNNILSKSQIPVSSYKATQQKLMEMINGNLSLYDMHLFSENLTFALQAEIDNMNVSVSKQPTMVLPYLKDSCLFASSVHCNLSRDFKPTFTSSLNRCYTFHYEEKATYFQRGHGHSFGLQIIMFLNQSDIVPLLGTQEGAGFSIFIHSRGTLPSLGSGNVYVSPGFSALIAIRKTETMLKKHPYPSDCSDGEGILNYFPGNYSSKGCFMSCVLDTIYNLCGYADPIMRMHFETKKFPKTTLKMLQCREKFINEVLLQGGVTSCICPKACKEERFDYSVSQSKWPVDADLPFYKYYAEKIIGIDASNITNEFIAKSLLKVMIYFEDLSVLEFREKAALDEWALIGDIGGHLGFWCGASVFSVFEVIAFLFAVISAALHSSIKKRKCSVSKTEDGELKDENVVYPLPTM